MWPSTQTFTSSIEKSFKKKYITFKTLYFTPTCCHVYSILQPSLCSACLVHHLRIFRTRDDVSDKRVVACWTNLSANGDRGDDMWGGHKFFTVTKGMVAQNIGSRSDVDLSLKPLTQLKCHTGSLPSFPRSRAFKPRSPKSSVDSHPKNLPTISHPDKMAKTC